MTKIKSKGKSSKAQLDGNGSFVEQIAKRPTVVLTYSAGGILYGDGTPVIDERYGTPVIAPFSGLWSTFGADFDSVSIDAQQALWDAMRAVYEELRPDLALKDSPDA